MNLKYIILTEEINIKQLEIFQSYFKSSDMDYCNNMLLLMHVRSMTWHSKIGNQYALDTGTEHFLSRGTCDYHD